MKPIYGQVEVELAKAQDELAKAQAELVETRAELAETKALLKLALDEIADLKEKLNLNSKNSSKPPSTDQKANTSLKERKRRKSRKGVARSVYPHERVDKSVDCVRESCPHCGSQSIENAGAPEALQQAELPQLRAIVTEYLLHKYTCKDCGRKSTATLPTGVPDSAFGPRLMGLFATLTGALHVARREAIQLIKDLYDVDIGLGSAPNIEERVAKALDPVYDRIHYFVIEGTLCKHFDETTWRNSGKRQYAWIASCSLAAFFKLHTNRSRKAFEELVGKQANGFKSVTDRYSVYATIGKLHQYYLAHLIRDFRRYAERDGPDGEIGEALAHELAQACRIHKDYRDGKISLKQRNMRIDQHPIFAKIWGFRFLASLPLLHPIVVTF